MFVYCKRLVLFLFILSPILARRARELKMYADPNCFVLKDLSAKHDLDGYLASLEDIIGFCVNNKDYLDVNLAFGLFLINVHLKTIFNGNNKCKKLPEPLLEQLESIVSKNDQILKYFNGLVMKKRPKVDANIKIATMFIDETKWMKRLPKFNTDLLNQSLLSYSQFSVKPNWKSYSGDVSDIDNWIPSPDASDKCMASLASCPIERTGKNYKCKISPSCKKNIINGTDFGYAFTHRLLMLQSAYFARGCSIFSERLDKEIRNSICATAYLEAEYISMNDYGIVDLILEIIALCALDGHAQFLRSSWLRDIQQFQTPYGCFSETKANNKGYHIEKRPKSLKLVYDTRNKKYNLEWIDKEKHDKLNDKCNGHVTAVAAASLSAAVRFIIETYY